MTSFKAEADAIAYPLGVIVLLFIIFRDLQFNAASNPFARNRSIDVGPLVSRRLSLCDFDSGFRIFLAGDALKVRLTIGD